MLTRTRIPPTVALAYASIVVCLSSWRPSFRTNLATGLFRSLWPHLRSAELFSKTQAIPFRSWWALR